MLQYQTLSLQLYLVQDEACPLTNNGRGKSMEVQGETPPKTLVNQFHVHLLTNKQGLSAFKILCISSTFTYIAIPFVKSIS